VTASTPVAPRTRRLGGLEVLALGAVAVVLLRPFMIDAFDVPVLQSWATVFVSISLQAMPFLVGGTLLSGAIAAFLPQDALSRILPRRPALAVPMAGISGVALPGCECGSVPIAGRLMAGGAAPAVALTFLLAAPAINPIVLIATAVAFPGQPEVVVARFVASLAAAVIVGWVWIRVGRTEWVERALRRHRRDGSRLEVLRGAMLHDLLHAGGFLVVGAAAAATLQTIVPRSILEAIGGQGVAAVLTMAALAVLLSICSEADAFVAASLTTFSPTSKLVFMVVGPAVDLKLIALQAGVFSRGFALRFAPLSLVVSTLAAVVVGMVLL
jgi:uncharacterized protein